jgi:hypothetical protein
VTRARENANYALQKLLLSGLDELPNASCQCTTYERTYDEDPEVSQCGATLEDSRSQRTGGVN